MDETKELKKIKKMYGENFMKLCRELFPTLLEQEGLLYEVLSSSFSKNSRTLGEDIKKEGLEGDFKNYIYSQIDVEGENKRIIEERTPYELMDEAGYDLFECTTEEEIQKFKKYYKKGEELCTFNGGRLDRCVVFFAVKKDAEEIKREDFKDPKREDEYGTSVMGIQFNKSGNCTVSIKNRYNHTVNNPDATYGNDLDRITPGLTQCFEKLLLQRGLELNNTNIEKFSIPGYTVANDGKYYKYNMEINGIYYCPGNIVIEHGQVNKLENPEKQLLIENFVLDMENKTIQLYDKNDKDGFVDGLENIEKIEILKDKKRGNGERILRIKKKNEETSIEIKIDKNNQIIGYKNDGLMQVGDAFLWANKGLTQLELPNLTQVGDNFLCNNQGLTQLELPNLTQVGDAFLYDNQGLTQLELPNLTQVGGNFLCDNQGLTQLELPNLTQVGGFFLCNNQGLTQLELPNLTQVGIFFLRDNQGLTQLELPNLTQVGYVFLYNNQGLTQLELPNLTQVGSDFLYKNKGLTQLELPNLTQVGGRFLGSNEGLTQLELPNLTQVGDDFLWANQGLTQLELPNLTQVGGSFLCNNQGLTQLELPNLTQVGNSFLCNNQGLTQLELPKAPEVKERFSDIINRNLQSHATKTKKEIDAKSIAELDKNNEITTSEIDCGRRSIEKLKSLFEKNR